MRSGVGRVLHVAAIWLLALAAGVAQERTPAGAAADPRVGLKAGLHDAGQAARNMELISNVPKPEGFFDPKMPAGMVTPPEHDARDADIAAAPVDRRSPAFNLDFANSDVAFRQSHLFV